MRRPEVSVVIPCLDESRTFRDCLAALARQDLPRDRYEVIVVDGGSTDGSAEIADEHGARLVHDLGRGPGAARNLGVRVSRGEVLAFTDADCVPADDWLRLVLEVLEKRPDAGGVAGPLRLPRDTLLGRLEDNDAVLSYAGYITSNVAYRREVFEEVGGFDETLTCCEDYDLAWRVLDAGHAIVRSERPLVLHAPPEIGGSIGGYLRKQFWYARHDVPAHARALRRARGGMGAGGASAMEGALHAGAATAGVLALAGAALLRRPRLAALAAGALFGPPARAALRGARRVAALPGDAPRLAAVAAARRAVRGAGTLVGLADLVRGGALTAPTAEAPRDAALVRLRPRAA